MKCFEYPHNKGEDVHGSGRRMCHPQKAIDLSS